MLPLVVHQNIHACSCGGVNNEGSPLGQVFTRSTLTTMDLPAHARTGLNFVSPAAKVCFCPVQSCGLFINRPTLVRILSR